MVSVNQGRMVAERAAERRRQLAHTLARRNPALEVRTGGLGTGQGSSSIYMYMHVQCTYSMSQKLVNTSTLLYPMSLYNLHLVLVTFTYLPPYSLPHSLPFSFL